MAKFTYKEVMVNESLLKNLIEESEQHKIMTERYNFVVDLLTEEQQRELHQWYVDTGVIEEWFLINKERDKALSLHIS